MSKKHFKNRIRVLNDHQATKDPNFKNLPLGTDRSWNYGHAKNMFVYIADLNSQITVSFKAFLTSYAMDVTDEKVLACHSEYGSKIVAYIERDNVFGAQFHPEKSQQFGIKFIENFINLC